MTGRKERKKKKKKIQLRPSDSNPQPLAYVDTTACAKGEPELVGRESGSYPVEEHCSCF